MSKTKTYALSAILDFSERLQCVQLTNSVRIHIRSRAFALLNTPLIYCVIFINVRQFQQVLVSLVSYYVLDLFQNVVKRANQQIWLVYTNSFTYQPIFSTVLFFWENKRHLNLEKKCTQLCAHMILVYTIMILTFLLTLTCNNSNKIVENAPEHQ